jgi:hypothetical protein
MADRSDAFRPLGAILSNEARRLKLDGPIGEASALTLWPRVVGEQIASATEPERVRDGVLYVIARNHTWAFELTFHREKILHGLNQRLGRHALKEIRFRPGVISPRGAPLPSPEAIPADAELEALSLQPVEIEVIEQEAARIADPEIQEAVRRLLTNERKRAAWHRQRGDRECAGCGAVHSGPGDTCPACRNEAER